MPLVHWILGRLILFFDWVTSPRGIKRNNAVQDNIDSQTVNLVLYQYKACPFCVKVRRAIKRQSLNIETRDAKRSVDARDELLQGGGILKVPCLKIEDTENKVKWLYESRDIITYLQHRFGTERNVSELM